MLFITLAFANYSHASKPKKLTESITWELKDDGTLIISGKGDMPDYYYTIRYKSPWYKYSRKKQISIKSVIIEEGITSIGDYAFYNNSITTLTIPNSVTNIGDWAFYCNDITTLNIPNSVKNIGDYAFRSNGITTLTIPNSVTYIGDKAFYQNDIITLTIPDSVNSIGDEAFAPKSGEVSSARIIHLPSWVTDKDCERIGISVDSYYEYGTPTVEWLLKKSNELFYNNNYEEALKYILRAINNEATTGPTAECYEQVGYCYFLLNSYNDAIKMFLEAYMLYSTDDYGKGSCAWLIGDIYRKYFNSNEVAYTWYTIASNLGNELASEDLCEYYEETTASVNKIWAANTKDNTIFHLNNLSVNYAFKEKVTLILNIYDENKRQLTDKNNKYYSPDGYVQFNYEIASVKYLKSIWEDFTITVPTSEIHIDRTKKSRTPYCKLIVKDKDGKIVYTSPYFQFTLDKIETAAPAPTAASAKKSSTTETTQTKQQSNSTTTSVSTNTGNVGGFVSVQQQTYTPRPVEVKHYESVYVDVDCRHCYGSGRCQSCNGTGMIDYSFGSGKLDCPNCHNGRCQYCNGSGKVKERQTVERTEIVYR